MISVALIPIPVYLFLQPVEEKLLSHLHTHACTVVHTIILYNQWGLLPQMNYSGQSNWVRPKSFVVSKLLWAAQVISASGNHTITNTHVCTYKQALRKVSLVSTVSITPLLLFLWVLVYWEMPVTQLKWVQFNLNFSQLSGGGAHKQIHTYNIVLSFLRWHISYFLLVQHPVPQGGDGVECMCVFCVLCWCISPCLFQFDLSVYTDRRWLISYIQHVLA